MKRHALFVGVDKYADGHIPNLSCAVNDAIDLHWFFKYGAGYDHVELLANPAGEKEISRLLIAASGWTFFKVYGLTVVM